MANKKITDLTDIGTPANDDLLEIVDVSDLTDSPEGTSKKVLVSALGGGSTPTLQEVLDEGTNATFIDDTFEYYANDGLLTGTDGGYAFDRSSQWTDEDGNFYDHNISVQANQSILGGQKANEDYSANGVFDVNEGKLLLQQDLGDGTNIHTKKLSFEDSDFPLGTDAEFNFVFPKDEDEGIRKIATREWVEDNVEERPLILISDVTKTTILGVSVLTPFRSYLIPANTLVNYNILHVVIKGLKQNNTGNGTLRLFINTSNNFATATEIGRNNLTTVQNFAIERNYELYSTTLEGYIFNSSLLTDITNVNAANSTTTYNRTNDLYFWIAITPNSITEDHTLKMVRIIAYKEKTTI
jgi:hypothetical protein